MKSSALFFLLAASVAVHAQTAAKPAATAAKPHTAAATKPHAATGAAHTAASTGATKLPPHVPPVPGIVKTAFSLRYQDVKIGTGPDAVPMKLYKVKYTGYRAKDGVKFDSWDQHAQPLMDKDNKPVMGDDGKPKMGEPQPATFPIGLGRMIPGFDQGFTGMKVGGKRRLFIPWQLAYGTREMPDHGPDHPGIPAKSDLIFDVELVDVTDLPIPANHPGMPGAPGGAMHPPTPPPTPPPSSAPASAPATPPPPSSAAPTPPPQPATPPPSSTTPPPTPAPPPSN